MISVKSSMGTDPTIGPRTPTTPAYLRTALLGVALLLSAGCSALFDFDTQCASDGDCDGDRCVAGACTAGPLPCARHTDCDQSPGADGAPNGAELCIAGQCQALLFENESGGGCSEMFGRLTDEPSRTLVIPTLQSLTGEGAAFGPETAVNGYRMATRFANESGGLGQRSVVMVLCDDASSARAAEDVARTIIERSGATSMLGPTGENSQEAILNVTIPQEIMTCAATTSILYSNLVDNDLAFRVYPSDQLSLDGVLALTRRYPGSSIGLLYREDALVRRVLGESLRQALVDEDITSASYLGNDPSSIAEAARTVAAGNDGAPVDMLVVIGLGETADAVVAYRDALDTGFSEQIPRIVTDAPGALIIPALVEAIDAVEPTNVEAIVGAAISTEDFASLYQVAFDTNENLQLTGVFYDAAMLTILTHAVVPDARSGLDLVAALRERVTAPDGKPVVGSNGILAFGSAAAALGNGESIQYIQAAGGRPTVFDTNGDVQYPVIAGTFLDAEASFFFPIRALFGPVWVDVCGEAGMPCQAGWTTSPDDPGQMCVDVGLGLFNICAPVCEPGETTSCPTPEMMCAPPPDEGPGLCFVGQ